jgi:hypothetical protein
MNNAKECLLDVVSHHNNVIEAFNNMVQYHLDRADKDNADYWRREIKVAERMKAQAELALKDLSEPAVVVNKLGALAPTLHGCIHLKQGDKLYFLDLEHQES